MPHFGKEKEEKIFFFAFYLGFFPLRVSLMLFHPSTACFLEKCEEKWKRKEQVRQTDRQTDRSRMHPMIWKKMKWIKKQPTPLLSLSLSFFSNIFLFLFFALRSQTDINSFFRFCVFFLLLSAQAIVVGSRLPCISLLDQNYAKSGYFSSPRTNIYSRLNRVCINQ